MLVIWMQKSCKLSCHGKNSKAHQQVNKKNILVIFNLYICEAEQYQHVEHGLKTKPPHGSLVPQCAVSINGPIYTTSKSDSGTQIKEREKKETKVRMRNG
jgi:hypothetical protein